MAKKNKNFDDFDDYDNPHILKDDNLKVPEVIQPTGLANPFVKKYEDYREDEFICMCASNGGVDKTVDNYLKCFDPPDGADEEQVKCLAHELKLKLYGQIQERRKELRKEGLLNELEATGCTVRQLAFVEYYLLNSGKNNRVSEAYIYAYNGGELPRHILKVRAQDVLRSAGVQFALEKYRKQMEEDVGVSFAEYLQELNENREQAKRFGQVSAMNAATIAKGRAMGYDKINVKGSEEEKSIEDLLKGLGMSAEEG